MENIRSNVGTGNKDLNDAQKQEFRSYFNSGDVITAFQLLDDIRQARLSERSWADLVAELNRANAITNVFWPDRVPQFDTSDVDTDMPELVAFESCDKPEESSLDDIPDQTDSYLPCIRELFSFSGSVLANYSQRWQCARNNGYELTESADFLFMDEAAQDMHNNSYTFHGPGTIRHGRELTFEHIRWSLGSNLAKPMHSDLAEDYEKVLCMNLTIVAHNSLLSEYLNRLYDVYGLLFSHSRLSLNWHIEIDAKFNYDLFKRMVEAELIRDGLVDLGDI